MGKYDPLAAILAAQDGPVWRASLAELEERLGFVLPKTARAGQAWWVNGPWTGQGWDAQLDRAQDLVTFRRQGASTQLAPAEDPPILQRLEISPKLGAALLAGGVAIVAGLGALAIRRFVRKRGGSALSSAQGRD